MGHRCRVHSDRDPQHTSNHPQVESQMCTSADLRPVICTSVGSADACRRMFEMQGSSLCISLFCEQWGCGYILACGQ